MRVREIERGAALERAAVGLRIPRRANGRGRARYGIAGTAPLTETQRRGIVRALIARYGGSDGLMRELALIEQTRREASRSST
jgi:hypothetical protein